MNFKTLIPVAAAVAGFLLGWGVKPSAEKGSASEGAAGDGTRHGSGNVAGLDSSRSGRPSRPGIPKNSVTSLAPTQDEAAMQQRLQRAFQDAGSVRDRAKLVRMAEALGLTTEQLDQFEGLLAEQLQHPLQSGPGDSPKARLEKMAESAKAFDTKFRALLSPEQTAALETLGARQAENRSVARVQRELADFISKVDVSPEQREAVAEVLSNFAATETSKLPPGAELLMESSYLPRAVGSINDSSIESMMAMGDETASVLDPIAAGRKIGELQRERTLARATALEGILTPAQLAQYRAVAEAQNVFNGVGGALPKP